MKPPDPRGRPLGSYTTRFDVDIAVLEVSRVRKWQLQRIREGKCQQCGTARPEGSRCLCLPCVIARRERQREKSSSQRRNWGAKSYRVESGGPR